MMFWWECDKLGDHWIKGRKSPLEANSTLLRLVLRVPKSPLLIATSPCAQFDPSSTGNQNGENRKHLNLTLLMEYMRNFNGIRIYIASNSIVGRLLDQDDVRVSEKSKMAAWSRKKIWNNVYLSLHTIATIFQRHWYRPMFSILSNTTGLI